MDVHNTIFLFWTRNTLYEQVWSKNQNCQIKLIFCTLTNFEYAEFNGNVHIFCFGAGNTLFGLIWSKKSKLSNDSEIWYQDLFDYAELNGDVQFFWF